LWFFVLTKVAAP